MSRSHEEYVSGQTSLANPNGSMRDDGNSKLKVYRSLAYSQGLYNDRLSHSPHSASNIMSSDPWSFNTLATNTMSHDYPATPIANYNNVYANSQDQAKIWKNPSVNTSNKNLPQLMVTTNSTTINTNTAYDEFGYPKSAPPYNSIRSPFTNNPNMICTTNDGTHLSTNTSNHPMIYNNYHHISTLSPQSAASSTTGSALKMNRSSYSMLQQQQSSSPVTAIPISYQRRPTQMTSSTSYTATPPPPQLMPAMQARAAPMNSSSTMSSPENTTYFQKKNYPPQYSSDDDSLIPNSKLSASYLATAKGEAPIGALAPVVGTGSARAPVTAVTAALAGGMVGTTPSVVGAAAPLVGGGVLIVYNLKVGLPLSVKSLFNLFSLYGIVERVKILRDKPDSALVQYNSSQSAAIAHRSLQGVCVSPDACLQLSFSRNKEVRLPPPSANYEDSNIVRTIVIPMINQRQQISSFLPNENISRPTSQLIVDFYEIFPENRAMDDFASQMMPPPTPQMMYMMISNKNGYINNDDSMIVEELNRQLGQIIHNKFGGDLINYQCLWQQNSVDKKKIHELNLPLRPQGHLLEHAPLFARCLVSVNSIATAVRVIMHLQDDVLRVHTGSPASTVGTIATPGTAAGAVAQGAAYGPRGNRSFILDFNFLANINNNKNNNNSMAVTNGANGGAPPPPPPRPFVPASSSDTTSGGIPASNSSQVMGNYYYACNSPNSSSSSSLHQISNTHNYH